MVTIIVLLILAMVSVSLVLRGNIIEKANLAVTEYQKSAEEENLALDRLEDEINKYIPSGNNGSTPEKNKYGFYENVVYYCKIQDDEFYMTFSIDDADDTSVHVRIKDFYQGELYGGEEQNGEFRITQDPSYRLESGTERTLSGLFMEGYSVDYGLHFPTVKVDEDGTLNYVSVGTGRNNSGSYVAVDEMEVTKLNPKLDINFDELV